MTTASLTPQVLGGAAAGTGSLTRDEVLYAYSRVLGRAPENKAVIADKIANFPNLPELVLSLVYSKEFKHNLMVKSVSVVQPKTLIVVGTHHKTGTEWMGDVFRTISHLMQFKFYNGVQPSLGAGDQIFLQVDSAFNLPKLPPYRGLHIIRDPRDVIISGAAFHEKTAEEEWLLEPKGEFGEMSYQEKLRSLDSLHDKLVFEMNGRGKKTIHQMTAWNYRNENFYEVKYEDLVVDHDLALFSRIFLFLGLSGAILPICLDVAWSRSIFSGALRKHGVHIRSGRPQQWRSVFTKRLARQFHELFGDALIRLGYETDQSWVDDLADE